MTDVKQFALPDVGEGLTEAEIVTWLVQPGDIVEVNQIIVEIETAKSLVELPSPFAGEVTELHASAGETVDVGHPIISIAAASDTASTESTTPAAPAAPSDFAVSDAGGDEEPKLLVGYGARETANRRRRRSADSTATRAAAVKLPTRTKDRTGPPKAKPPVRKLAKVLGVDLISVLPAGADGIVTRSDVLAAAESRLATGTGIVPATPAPGRLALDTNERGDIRIPIKGMRKHTAAAMVTSAFTAPHVTEFITLDMSRTMDLRTEIGRRPEFADIKLSPLAFVARAFLHAIERTPEANSRWDEEAQEIVQMREVNLGIAAATPRGLVVPNIKGAQRLSLGELAGAIAALAATARAGKTDPLAMANGTVTITNVGVFGVDTGTPILNPGETAILAFGAVRRMPWVVGRDAERIEARWVTQLALSFDHRVMDGQQGSQLLADTAAFLHEPGLAVL